MSTNEFIKNFSAQFNEADPEIFSLETKFRDLDEWDSMLHLSIILMLDQEYNVTIEEKEFNKLTTIGDIYNYIVNKNGVS